MVAVAARVRTENYPDPMTVPVRDAATVMLVRDAVDRSGQAAIEVCMLRRNLESEFVAGAFVFPGGSVDPSDRGNDAESLCRGLTDAEASTILDVESGGLAFWVAALRECFEEAGVLVARPVGGDELLNLTDPADAARFGQHRVAVYQGTLGLLDLCRSEGLELATDTVHYVSHWITPEVAPKRYDTRFFVTTAPPAQAAHHDEGETIASLWVRPADALDRFAAGEIELLPPTIANLRQLADYRSAADVMAWAGAVTEVETILPIVVIEDGEIAVLRPGDEGYEQALEERLNSGEPLPPELVRAARRAWGPRADRT